MSDFLEINGEKIGRDEDRKLNLRIARLPTYTNIDLPVRVIRSENPGPIVLLTGGLHGDEINGIEIVRRLLSNKLLKLEKGSVVAIPLMNIYGFIQSVRGVPDVDEAPERPRHAVAHHGQRERGAPPDPVGDQAGGQLPERHVDREHHDGVGDLRLGPRGAALRPRVLGVRLRVGRGRAESGAVSL